MLHERITIDPKVMFGKPVIKGTRVTVELIPRKIGEGMTDEQILEHHPHLTIEDVRASTAFAADHLAAEEIVVKELVRSGLRFPLENDNYEVPAELGEELMQPRRTRTWFARSPAG